MCFDCLATVNEQSDVRTCQRRAADGDVVHTQHDPLPEAPSGPPVEFPGPPYRLTETPAVIARPPRLGEHTAAVLAAI